MSSNLSTLIPGYRHVESFGADDEYERDENGNIVEEVEYVTLDVGVVEPTLVPSSSAYRLIDLDTPSPFLQLSGTVFKGSHQELLGTELLFTDSKDEAERAKKALVHVGNTEKRIRFREVELREKEPEIASDQVGPTPREQTNVNPKKRIPQTVGEIAGNLPVEETQTRRGGRRGRKSKGKERETVASDDVQSTDTTEIAHTSRDAQDAAPITQAPAEPMDLTED